VNGEQIAVLTGASVLVFWMLGAYNRLVELRNAIGSAWKQVDDALRRRAEAIATVAAPLRANADADVTRALDVLRDAEARLRAAADALGARPVRASAAGALAAAEAAVESALAVVLRTAEGEAVADEAAAQAWRAIVDSGARLAFARQLFNERSATYNAAARQFPTRLLTRLYGFGTAGRL
jgi:LemA protein